MAQPLVRRGVLNAALWIVALGALAAPAAAQSSPEIEALKQQMQELIKQNQHQQQQIQQLQEQVQGLSAPAARTPVAKAAAAPAPVAPESDEAAIDKALAEVRPPTDVTQPASVGATATRPALLARRVGGAEIRLIDVSFDVLTAAGSSTVGGQTLRDLQGGAHDPNRRGFTLQQGELSLAGAVDPYFIGEAHIVFTDSVVELEEAFFVTTSLPWDLQVKGGYFLTDFGRINPVHPHAWTYLDQNFMMTRLFGGDGLRSPGVQVDWLAPLPWFSEVTVGMQNGDEGEFAVSFLNSEGGVGGRPPVSDGVHNLSDFIYLARWANSWDISPEITGLVGVSGLYGDNVSGPDAPTFIYGADLTFKYRPLDNFRGWPFVVWQTEVLKRDYTADRFVAGTAEGEDGAFPNNLPSAILRDYGFYSQLSYGFLHPWAAGLRVEYGTGRGDSVMDGELVSRNQDPLRSDRLRIAPLLIYHPSEFSRIRLQYNFDDAKFLPGDHTASSVWLGVEFLYGTHPAHQY
ncbi:MAG: hypothetical protein ACRERC_20925 [Candidatus Binatia bacterium]